MKTIILFVACLVASGLIHAQPPAQPSTSSTAIGPPAGMGFGAAQPATEPADGGSIGGGIGAGGFTGGGGMGGMGYGGGMGAGGFGFGGGMGGMGHPPGRSTGVASSDSFAAGLLSEEGEQDLHAAEAAYRQAIQQFDRQREGAANAIFRLGEVYRKMGRGEEAKVQYARILREFPDMVHLTELSHARLIGDEARIRTTGRTGPTRPTPFADPATVPSAEHDPGDYDRVMMERYGLRPEAAVHGVVERGSCYANLKNLGLSARIYAHAHQTAYPSTVLEMREEIGRPELLICQADRERQVAASWADFDPAIHMTYEYGGDSVTERDVDRILFRCPIHGHRTLGDGSVLWQETTPLRQAVTPPPLHSDDSSLTYWSAVLERKGVSREVVEDIQSEIEIVHHIRSWLRAIDHAKQQWALEKRQPPGALPTMKDLSGYMSGEPPITQAGERYEINAVGVPPVAILTAPIGSRKPGDHITIHSLDVLQTGPVRTDVHENADIAIAAKSGTGRGTDRAVQPGTEARQSVTSTVDAVVLQRYGLPATTLQGRRSEEEIVNAIINRLRQIDGAKQQWALENRQPQNARPTANDIADYLRGGYPIPIAGERYEINTVGEPPVAILTKPVGNLNPGDRITIGPPAQAVKARPAEPIRIQIREDGSIEVDDERIEVGALPNKLRQRIAEGRRSVALAAEDQAPPESVMAVVNAAFDPRLRPLEVDGTARTLIQREAARWTVEIADLEQKAASLHQESRRLFDQNALLTRELREAEERVEPARQRRNASRFDPVRLPGMISQDERYQKFRAEYEAAVLDGDEEAGKRARARLSQWVERIYQPELEEELRFAHDTVSEIRSRQEALQDHRQRVDAQFNQIQEQVERLRQQRTRLRTMIPNLEAEP